MRCTHFTNPKKPEDTRCPNSVVQGYTRCFEHGGGDIREFYTRQFMEDEKIRFYGLYDNIIEKYNIPTDDQLLVNLLAATCRKLIQCHNAENFDKDIQQVLSLARELAITPKERKHSELHVHMDKKTGEAIQSVEDIVAERLALTEK